MPFEELGGLKRVQGGCCKIDMSHLLKKLSKGNVAKLTCAHGRDTLEYGWWGVTMLWHNSCPRMKIYGRRGYNARPGAANKVATLLTGVAIPDCILRRLTRNWALWLRGCDITRDQPGLTTGYGSVRSNNRPGLQLNCKQLKFAEVDDAGNFCPNLGYLVSSGRNVVPPTNYRW